MNSQLKPMTGTPVGYSISITQRLEEQKRELELRLERINKALEALKRNPEVAEVVNTISQIDNIY